MPLLILPGVTLNSEYIIHWVQEELISSLAQSNSMEKVQDLVEHLVWLIIIIMLVHLRLVWLIIIIIPGLYIVQIAVRQSRGNLQLQLLIAVVVIK